MLDNFGLDVVFWTVLVFVMAAVVLYKLTDGKTQFPLAVAAGAAALAFLVQLANGPWPMTF